MFFYLAEVIEILVMDIPHVMKGLYSAILYIGQHKYTY